ncbi:metallophosphoesterase [Leuconostoc lactis]|uniref:metallophosphoesterase n=1 Tax=Leuconostoc lactis TaxID=1246 RepID=UPI003D6AB87E
MTYFKWTDEYKVLVKSLYGQGMTTKQVIDYFFDRYALNVSRRSVQRFRDAPQVQTTKLKDVARGTEIVINKDGSQTSSTTLQMTQEQAKDPDYVLKAHGFDPDAWEIVSAKNNFWQQNSQDNGLIDLYQSKITVKPIAKLFSIRDMVSVFNRDIKPVEVRNIVKGRNSILIPLFDMHFGITRLDKLQGHLQQIANILKSGHKNVEIIIGGDVLHSDFITKSQTSSNTQLDPVKTIRALNEAEEFFSSLIELSLKYSGNVEVKAVSGNHDTDSQYMFVWGLSKKFPQVEFENVPNTERLAFQFDKIGVMVAHGNLALKHLPMLFANEYSDIWSSSTYRLIASGHFHTEKLQDVDGVVMHQFGTVKPNDPYEVANGYTVGRKHLQLLEFNNERLKATYEVE